jgi:hypothetical protein
MNNQDSHLTITGKSLGTYEFISEAIRSLRIYDQVRANVAAPLISRMGGYSSGIDVFGSIRMKLQENIANG